MWLKWDSKQVQILWNKSHVKFDSIHENTKFDEAEIDLQQQLGKLSYKDLGRLISSAAFCLLCSPEIGDLGLQNEKVINLCLQKKFISSQQPDW